MGRAFVLQAADGMRGGRVTGVQTCALPISAEDRRRSWARARAESGPGASSPRARGTAPDAGPFRTPRRRAPRRAAARSEEHTSELQSPVHLVGRLLLERKKERVVVREAIIK